MKLRVRAEYAENATALGAITSQRATQLERALDRFSQANSVLRARDLGMLVCSLRIGDLSRLDALWRDYVSGKLIDALAPALLTETLRHAVNNEHLQLMLAIDDADFENARLTLVQNL